MSDFFKGLAPNFEQRTWDALWDTPILFWVIFFLGLAVLGYIFYKLFEWLLRVVWKKNSPPTDADKTRGRAAKFLVLVAAFAVIYASSGWAPTARDVGNWASGLLNRWVGNFVIAGGPEGISFARVDEARLAEIATVFPTEAAPLPTRTSTTVRAAECTGLEELPNMPGVYGDATALAAVEGQKEWHIHFSTPATTTLCISMDAELPEISEGEGVARLVMGSNLTPGDEVTLKNIPAGHYAISK